jgi:hypothetical protein
VRRRLAALTSLVLLLPLAACGSSGHPKPTPSLSGLGDGCTWSSAASAGGLIGVGAVLVSIDPHSGAVLGSCAGRGMIGNPPHFTVRGEDVSYGAGTYARPMVAGPTIRYVPDNDVLGAGASGYGGVRAVAGGARHRLAFRRWLVITTIGNHLMIERSTHELSSGDGDESDSPHDWCVLPSWSSALSACTPVTTSSIPGSPAVTPDGHVSWIPQKSVPLAIGSLHGYAATDGSIVTGYATPAGRDDLLVGVDGHTVLFAPGNKIRPAGTASALAWATVTSHSGSLEATVTRTPFEPSNIHESTFALMTLDGGFQSAPDGRSIAVMDGSTDGVLIVTAAGHATTVKPKLPKVFGDAGLVRWPFGS